MTLEEQLADKLSPKTIGYHLGNYADLFIKPIKTWRKIISPRTSSYNLLILHLIYYTLFTYLIFRDLKLAVPIVIAEVVMTALPWLAFVAPFKYFIRKNNKRINSVRLFRLLLIIKLQCAPCLVILVLLANYTRLDIFYLLFDNLAFIFFVLCIVALPLILELRFRTRLVWIFVNYIFFLISFGLIGWIIYDSDVLEKVNSRNPTSEYLDFKTKTSHSRLLIDDSYYFVLAVIKESDSSSQLRPQFATHELISSFFKKESNINKRLLLKLDTSLKRRNSIQFYSEKEELTIETADAIKLKTDSIFYKDMRLVREFKDSSYFPSNRNYFDILYRYFKNYELNFINRPEIEKIVETKKAFGNVQFNDSVYGFLFLDSLQFKPIKREIKDIEHRFEKRFDYSMFSMTILFYPIMALEELLVDE